MPEMKNLLEGFNSKLELAEKSAEQLIDRDCAICQEKRRTKKNKQTLREMWDTNSPMYV